MERKAIFAIFVGAIMVLSAFAGFLFRGGDESASTTAAAVTGPVTAETFGVQGNVVNWNFNSLSDVLEMSPESTVMAYWIDLAKSQNLTDTARAVLPMAYGLSYGDSLYPSKVEKLGVIYFNNSWAEFQWTKPFQVGYDGLVVPYNGYMLIPSSSQYSAVMGAPVLFGPQKPLENVLDVVTGQMPTNKFTLPQGETADLQIAGLGKNMPPGTTGGFQEFYLGISKIDSGYSLSAKYLKPDADTSKMIQGIATKYGLAVSSKSGLTGISGQVSDGNMKDALKAFLAP